MVASKATTTAEADMPDIARSNALFELSEAIFVDSGQFLSDN